MQFECEKEDCDFSGSFRGISIHYTTVHDEEFNKKPYLKKEIKRLDSEHGKVTKKTMNEYGRFSTGVYQKEFGSWNNALKYSSIEINIKQNNSNEFILNELKRVQEECGKCTYNTVKEFADISPDLCRNRFGSFENAVEKAGVESHKIKDISKEQLSDELNRISEKINRTPRQKDIKAYSKYSISPFLTKYNSWNSALKENGFEVNYENGMTGKKHPCWKGGCGEYYGKEWENTRQKALKRANYECEHPDCSKEQCDNGRELVSHHIIPNRLTESKYEHNLDNLLVLCDEHHYEIEPSKRMTTPSEFLGGD